MTTRLRLAAGLALTVCLAAPAAAQVSSNFDSLSEGFKGTSFTADGITFSSVNSVSGLNPDGSFFTPGEYGDQVIVEKADYLYNDYPGTVSPMNVLSFGGAYIGGPNLSINLVTTFTMSIGQTAERVEFDLLYFENGPWGGIEIRLDARDASNTIVNNETIVISDLGGRDNLVWHHFDLSGAQFETVQLHAKYPNNTNTVFSGLIDNVVITPANLCPADVNNDGFLDNGDIGTFVELFLAQESAADFNGDGFLDNGDISSFVAAFLAGC